MGKDKKDFIMHHGKKIFSKKHIKEINKWKDYTKEDLIRAEEKWSDFLWFGRHLYLAYVGNVTIEKYPEAFKNQDRIINKYHNDKDFIRCFYFPNSPNGDEEWKEITNNVGYLRQRLYGRWNTDS